MCHKLFCYYFLVAFCIPEPAIARMTFESGAGAGCGAGKEIKTISNNGKLKVLSNCEVRTYFSGDLGKTKGKYAFYI